MSSADELEKEMKKLKITEKKQDKLLYVCFHVLLNMAEDIQVKKKSEEKSEKAGQAALCQSYIYL